MIFTFQVIVFRGKFHLILFGAVWPYGIQTESIGIYTLSI